MSPSRDLRRDLVAQEARDVHREKADGDRALELHLLVVRLHELQERRPDALVGHLAAAA